MDLSDGFISKEHQELIKSASESIDPSSASPLEVSNTPRTPREHHAKHDSNTEIPKGSVQRHDRHSRTGRDGRPKKGGSGGKGTWGGLLDPDDGYFLDPNDPNYDSNEENNQSNDKDFASALEEYKGKSKIIIEEYFATDDITATANELKELGFPSFARYFIKKLISMAMDRHDREKEMAAVLLSTLYADVIDPPQVYKGFGMLIESADDLAVDIPDTVDVLALFIARAIVDDILPPAFLTKQSSFLPKESKGIEVIRRTEKGYLSAPLHAEVVERRWGASKSKTVEAIKAKIGDLLIEYIASKDKAEACRCMKDLKVPFYHHEIVKRAFIMAMERRSAEGPILDLLKQAFDECVINSSQISKGVGRLIDTVDDLSLDIPNARELLKSLISKAASEGWLCTSSLRPFPPQTGRKLEDHRAQTFKKKAISIIREYFLSGDTFEVISILESEEDLNYAGLKALFVKKLITLAMERKNREKEMTSVLLSSLCFPADEVVSGFVQLIEVVEDTVLDVPVAVEDLALFIARAVVDEVLAPQQVEEIASQMTPDQEAVGSRVLHMTRSLLAARLSGERILRCWGGGTSRGTGWAIEDVKDKIINLLEEYESGGDLAEACRCIREIGMPFFHHEVVKKALVMAMEKKQKQQERLWRLLDECYKIGIITSNQMAKGFSRVAECMEDLKLDVPDVEEKYDSHVKRAKAAGWLDDSFSEWKTGKVHENGF
ncbi:unnamed protein product [Victoria cruziana]